MRHIVKKPLALAAILLLAACAKEPLGNPHLQQRVWITEFKAAGLQSTITPIAELPALVKHPPLDLADGLAHTATLSPDTRYFRIVCEVQCAFSTTGEATSNDIMLPLKLPEYFGVADQKSVSVIAAP